MTVAEKKYVLLSPMGQLLERDERDDAGEQVTVMNDNNTLVVNSLGSGLSASFTVLQMEPQDSGRVRVVLSDAEHAIFVAEINSDEGIHRINGLSLPLQLLTPREHRLYHAKGGKEQQKNSGEVKILMPGRVVSVLLTEGDRVNEGDAIVVIEAMKMESEVYAPCSGMITGLSCAAGDTVEGGALLCTVDDIHIVETVIEGQG